MTLWPGLSLLGDVKLKICLNLYDFRYISRHASAATSSYTTKINSLDASCSQRIETYIFEVEGVSTCKIIISLSPDDFTISALSVHHIRGF